jgi:hypothetical protein
MRIILKWIWCKNVELIKLAQDKIHQWNSMTTKINVCIPQMLGIYNQLSKFLRNIMHYGMTGKIKVLRN